MGADPLSVMLTEVADRVRAVVRDVAGRDAHPADPYRGLYVSDEQAVDLGAEPPSLELEQRFAAICARLELDPLECAVLGVCAAPEVHADFGRLYGYLHDDLSQRFATPRLAAQLVAGPDVTADEVLGCFDLDARLRSVGAIRVSGDGPLADRPVSIGPLLASHLLGSRLADDTAGGQIRRIDPIDLPLGRDDAIEQLRALLSVAPEQPLAIVGPDALLALARAGERGVVALAARALSDQTACDDLALIAALEGRIAAVDRLDELAPDDMRRRVAHAAALTCRPVLCAADAWDARALAELTAHIVPLPEPSTAEREVAWRKASGKRQVGELASSFRLEIGMIRDAVALARTAAAARGASISPDSLWSAAGAASSTRIGELARRLTPGPTWSDLILPERQTTALHTLSAFLRHRDRVISDWGYAQIAGERGLTALFAGESGTGKTMAARVIATELGLDVYRVDLSSLFSKWVGETEKNLDRIFGSAERSNAILFFDEADVVFGKRTESSDSSDRYANLETAFLLQRIEGYDGIVVLATNLRSNMDDAFVRRLDIVVDFPPPDADTRRRLWETLLPRAAPRADDIDLEFLATRFELSGGGIRNCSLAAALLAADDGDTIHMRHLIRAVAIEFTKLGRLTIEADFGRFHEVATKGPHSIASLSRGTKAQKSA